MGSRRLRISYWLTDWLKDRKREERKGYTYTYTNTYIDREREKEMEREREQFSSSSSSSYLSNYLSSSSSIVLGCCCFFVELNRSRFKGCWVPEHERSRPLGLAPRDVKGPSRSCHKQNHAAHASPCIFSRLERDVNVVVVLLVVVVCLWFCHLLGAC